jgi:predicted dehydrogenase
MEKLRIGILGAARIAPAAVVGPAHRLEDVEVTVVAARDGDRARAFAGRHGIPRSVGSYQAVLEDPTVDAVYNPLPNGLHGRWTLAALAAGKHVLCEKPFTADASEARQVAEAAEVSGLVVMEAFHYRYHPLFARVLAIVASGEIGTVEHIDAAMCFPLPRPSDIRWQLELAGGATMDAGCYAIHMLRHLAGDEPRVVTARAKLARPGVDRAMRADFVLPGSRTGRITASMLSSDILKMSARVRGDRGAIRVFNPVAPQFLHRLSVRTGTTRRSEQVTHDPTYLFQLQAFRDAVRSGGPVITGPADSVANMEVIDACYRAAGMEPRRPTV